MITCPKPAESSDLEPPASHHSSAVRLGIDGTPHPEPVSAHYLNLSSRSLAYANPYRLGPHVQTSFLVHLWYLCTYRACRYGRRVDSLDLVPQFCTSRFHNACITVGSF